MQYVTQTISISHRIVADATVTKEVQDQIAAEVRGLLLGRGHTIIMQLGDALNAQAERGEEAEATIRVTVQEEEITDVEAEAVNV